MAEDCIGHYEWELTNFKAKGLHSSESFEVGFYLWRVNVQQDSTNLAMFLEYPAASFTPAVKCPTAEFVAIVLNHKDHSKDQRKEMKATFTPANPQWGFTQMLPLAAITPDSGFLRDDGKLVVRVQLSVQRPGKRPRGVGSDLLALLDDPGATSDLSLTTGGRAFPVHRAVLAARCDFFRALFSSDMADSAARELPLPDADPDALSLLLRYAYGGVLDECPPPLLKPAAELADRLQLSDARKLLERRIEGCTTPGSIVGDLLWAAKHGSAELLAALEALYLRAAACVSLADITELADHNPRLLARLHDSLAKAKCT